MKKAKLKNISQSQPRINKCVPSIPLKKIPSDTRRAQNTANGIRRAKLMGRYPNKVPIGFINLTLMDGKKTIAPKEPEADIIKWSFHQAVQNDHKISEIMKIDTIK